MNKIIRVFPQRTSYTPDDDMVFIGEPPGLIIPECDEIHISCAFTWDMRYCEHLKYQWEMYSEKPVKLGGPAYFGKQPLLTTALHYGGDSIADLLFTPGMYVKQGITFTSRGCNNRCEWCAVSKREGWLVELPITDGNIIQDNNFLQCSINHKNRVFEMLKTQKGICFKGGLQANLIDDHFIENIKQLRISELWVACDTDEAIPAFTRAAEKLKAAGYTREHIRCYVLIGDDIEANEKRLQTVYNAGVMPFAQLYQPCHGERKDYSREWKMFHRQWSRPAAIVAHMERGTDMRDYNT